MPLAKKKTRSKKPTKVENINRGLMSTVRNTGRSADYGERFAGPETLNSKFWGTKPLKSGKSANIGQQIKGRKALAKSIKTQSKAAKKATRAAKRK